MTNAVCPSCQAKVFHVYGTIRHETCTERYRECLKCGARYVVMESSIFVRSVRQHNRGPKPCP